MAFHEALGIACLSVSMVSVPAGSGWQVRARLVDAVRREQGKIRLLRNCS